jgi:hypothetical protein
MVDVVSNLSTEPLSCPVTPEGITEERSEIDGGGGDVDLDGVGGTDECLESNESRLNCEARPCLVRSELRSAALGSKEPAEKLSSAIVSPGHLVRQYNERERGDGLL